MHSSCWVEIQGSCKWAISSCRHCCDYYLGTLSCNQVSATHLKIRHPSMKYVGNPSPNELQWLDIKTWHPRIEVPVLAGWGKHIRLEYPILTHWGRDKMAAISQTMFSNAFSWMKMWISLQSSLKFVPKGLINNIPSLVQIMAWRQPGDKPLSEPMMVSLLTHICVTRPQWVKHCNRSKAINRINVDLIVDVVVQHWDAGAKAWVKYKTSAECVHLEDNIKKWMKYFTLKVTFAYTIGYSVPWYMYMSGCVHKLQENNITSLE